MEHSSAVLKGLLILTCSVYVSLADTHTLQYLYTTGLHFPEFTAIVLVDGEQIVFYDSSIKKVILKTEWAKKIDADDPDYLSGGSHPFQSRQDWFIDNVATPMLGFNQTKEIHTVQSMYGCELDDDGTTRGYSHYGYDGEDFISLDLKGVSWSAAKPQAVITENKWKSTGYKAEHCKNFLTYGCTDRLKKFLFYARETLERKVRPKVSLFQRHSPSPEVVCHATGFFPKAVMISWQKDGEDVHEDVELRETLPNQDGSFQKRSILKVPAEELQKHTYTCVIQHSSLEEDLVLIERRTIKGGGSDGGQIGIIIGVVVGFVALIAIVAGIVIWRKKNSGFRPVPQKSVISSEGDSSSNNS